MRELGFVAVCSLMLFGCGGGSSDTIDAPANQADAAPVVLSCASYCATIATNCTGANVQYMSTTDCMNSCATWMEGATTDMSGNTLGCRTYHAGAAAGNPGLHCTHAGPGGNGACGANCDGFCTLVLGVCTGADEVYADDPTCQAACAGWAQTPAYSSTVQSGDSFACRMYHATAASTTPGLHCPHTADLSSTCN